MGRYTNLNDMRIVDSAGTELILKVGATDNSIPVSVPADEKLPTSISDVQLESGKRVPVSR